MTEIYVRLAYNDEQAAAAWLTRVFGFRERERKANPDGSAMIWLETVPWGDRRYEAFDLEGHWWHFAQRLG